MNLCSMKVSQDIATSAAGQPEPFAQGANMRRGINTQGDYAAESSANNRNPAVMQTYQPFGRELQTRKLLSATLVVTANPNSYSDNERLSKRSKLKGKAPLQEGFDRAEHRATNSHANSTGQVLLYWGREAKARPSCKKGFDRAEQFFFFFFLQV